MTDSDSDSEDARKTKAFSGAAIENLCKRLSSEKERKIKKVVYLSVKINRYGTDWLRVENLDGIKFTVYADFSADPGLKYPLLSGFGCSALGDNIITAGGKLLHGIRSRTVYIYNTSCEHWCYFLKMNTTRGEMPPPTVVVADQKIFVFGGGNSFNYINCWAEFCHLGGGDWNTQLPWDFIPWPSSPSDKIFYPHFLPNITSHAVYPNGNQILLYLSSPTLHISHTVLSFNYRNNTWKKYDADKPMSIGVGPKWSATVVVLEDFIFWYNHGTIYANDLLIDLTIPMYTLPPVFSSAHLTSDPKFLVHIGRGKLCLFYKVHRRICYMTFLVQISRDDGPPTPRVVFGHSGFLHTPTITCINHALEISSESGTAEQEKALREQGGGTGMAEKSVSAFDVQELGNANASNEREGVGSSDKATLHQTKLEAGSSSVQVEPEDVEEQPFVRQRSRRVNFGSDSVKESLQMEESSPSSPVPRDIGSHPPNNGTAFRSDELGCISSLEHDEAVMLEAALFGGIPEGTAYRFGYPSLERTYPRPAPRPPSPTLEVQRILREQQDDEYHASLQADREKELKAIEEAEARRLSEETARDAAFEEERRKEEEKYRKQMEEEAAERQLAAKEASLPMEPATGDENAVTLLVRMPDGTCRGRRFLKSDNVQSLFDFIDIGRVVKPGTYRLVRLYPRRDLSDGESKLSLSELGLTSKETLFLEQKAN